MTHFLMQIDTESESCTEGVRNKTVTVRSHLESLARCIVPPSAGKACRPWVGCPGWLLCWEQDGQPPVRPLQSPGPGPCQVLGECVSSAGPRSRASGLFLKSFQEEGKAAPELDPLPLTTEFLEPATCQLYSGGKWHSVQSPQQCRHTLVPDKGPSGQSHST